MNPDTRPTSRSRTSFDPDMFPTHLNLEHGSDMVARDWRKIAQKREQGIDRAWAAARRHQRSYSDTISKALNNVEKLREDEDVQEMARDLVVALEALLSFLINEQSPDAKKVVTLRQYRESWTAISEVDLALPRRGEPSNNNFVYLFIDDSRPRDLDMSLATVIHHIRDAKSVRGRGNQIEAVVDVVYVILDLVGNIIQSGDRELGRYIQENFPGFMGGRKRTKKSKKKKGKRKTIKRKTRRTKRRRKTNRKNRR